MKTHWKTTIAGLLVIVAEFLKVWRPQYAGPAEMLQQFVMGAGLLVAADGAARQARRRRKRASKEDS